MNLILRSPMARSTPYLWLLGFLFWNAILWFLSARTGDAGGLPPVPGIDKAAHFAFFGMGGVLLSAFMLRNTRSHPDWRRIFWITTICLTLVGVLDELHQSTVPGRSGNDPWDLLADIAGAATGTLLVRWGNRRWG